MRDFSKVADQVIPLCVFFGLLLIHSADDEEPEWIVEHAREERRTKAIQARHKVERRLAKARERERRLKERNRNDEPAIKRRVCEFSNNFNTSNADSFRKLRIKTRPTSTAKTTLRLTITKVMMAQTKEDIKEIWVCQLRRSFC